MIPKNAKTQIRRNTNKLREIDDSGNSNAVFRRKSNTALIGSATNPVIRAACTADAGAGATIAATLFNTDGTTGDAVTVYCNISNETDLNAATPRLEIGDEMFVTQSNFDNAGTPEERYYCVSNFMATEVCTCGA